MTSLTNVVLFHYDRTLSKPTIMRNFIAAAMQKHSSSRGGNAAMAYDAALREALTLIARNPSDPDRVRGMLDNRSLWAADPLHPGEGDPEMCPNFMWAHLNNITYDNCIKALGNKFSSIADTVPEGEGLALLNQMYQQAEPEGLGAVEDIESEMNECLYVDGNDITEHLTALQALIKKYETLDRREEEKISSEDTPFNMANSCSKLGSWTLDFSGSAPKNQRVHHICFICEDEGTGPCYGRWSIGSSRNAR